MTFADYYNKKNYLHGLQSSISSKLKKGPSQADCDKLQKYLQEIFYPKNASGQTDSSFIDNVIIQAYEKEQNRAIQNFQLGAKTFTFEEVDRIARSRFEYTSHSSHIYSETIKQRIVNINTLIDRMIANVSHMDPELVEQQIRELNQLKLEMEEFLRKYAGGEGQNVRINIKDDRNVFETVKHLDNIYEKYLTENIGVFIPKDYGDVLEYALNALNIPLDQLSGNIADHLLDQIVHTQGAQRIGTGGKISIKKSGQKFGTKKGENIKEQQIHIVDGKKSFDFKFTPTLDYNSSRQGKADVFLNIGFGGVKGFRISAKNWQDLDRDFGSTSVAYALLRSVGQTATKQYTYIMQDKNARSQLQDAHNLAKLSIIADILMGYSQSNAYADTLVINLRNGSASQIIVKSLKEVFNQLENNIETFTLKDYKENVIEQNLQSLSKSVNRRMREGRSKTYTDLALGYLNSISISLRYSEILT